MSEQEELVKLCAELRDLIHEDASSMMVGAMAGSPEDCIYFALQWIKRAKGQDYDKSLFRPPISPEAKEDIEVPGFKWVTMSEKGWKNGSESI